MHLIPPESQIHRAHSSYGQVPDQCEHAPSTRNANFAQKSPPIKSKKPGKGLDVLFHAIGPLSTRGGNEDAHDDIRGACSTLRVESDWPVTHASMLFKSRVRIEDDDKVRLVLEMYLRDDIIGRRGCEGHRKDSEGKEELHGSLTGFSVPPLFRGVANPPPWGVFEAFAVR